VESCECPRVIAAGETVTVTWKDVAMIIPAVAPSRLDGCQIIDVKYELKASQIFASVLMLVYFLGFLFNAGLSL